MSQVTASHNKLILKAACKADSGIVAAETMIEREGIRFIYLHITPDNMPQQEVDVDRSY